MKRIKSYKERAEESHRVIKEKRVIQLNDIIEIYKDSGLDITEDDLENNRNPGCDNYSFIYKLYGMDMKFKIPPKPIDSKYTIKDLEYAIEKNPPTQFREEVKYVYDFLKKTFGGYIWVEIGHRFALTIKGDPNIMSSFSFMSERHGELSRFNVSKKHYVNPSKHYRPYLWKDFDD